VDEDDVTGHPINEDNNNDGGGGKEMVRNSDGRSFQRRYAVHDAEPMARLENMRS